MKKRKYSHREVQDLYNEKYFKTSVKEIKGYFNK